MYTFEVETLVPFGRHWPRWTELRALQDRALRETSVLEGLTVDTGSAQVSVALSFQQSLKPSGHFAKAWTAPAGVAKRTYWFLVLSSVTSIDIEGYLAEFGKLNPDRPDLSEENAKYLSVDAVATEHTRLVDDMLLASNIAKPGALVPDDYLHFADGSLHSRHTAHHVNSLYWSWEQADKMSWPPIKEMPVSSVWSWFSRIPGLSDAAPRGRLGRAISSLSHLATRNSSAAEALMWAMVGLESLYLEGKSGLAEQLLSKAEIFLGAIQTNRKKFRALYDFRSRFIHGDIDFPLAYSPYDALPDYEKFEGQAYDFELIATAMLLATLQRMAGEERYVLTFEWKLGSAPAI